MGSRAYGHCRAKYRSFIERLVEANGAWILVSGNGPLETRVTNEQWNLPVWTSEAGALEFVNLKNLGSEFHPEFVPMDEFIDQAIPDLAQAGLHIHPNPQDEPVGLVVPPESARRNLRFISRTHLRSK